MKNSNDIIGRRIRDLLAYSAVPQPTIIISLFVVCGTIAPIGPGHSHSRGYIYYEQIILIQNKLAQGIRKPRKWQL
jgi:hypothetical protein